MKQARAGPTTWCTPAGAQIVRQSGYMRSGLGGGSLAVEVADGPAKVHSMTTVDHTYLYCTPIYTICMNLKYNLQIH